MDKIRVLQVLAEPFENGGQEMFVCNIYQNIDENIQFDFIAPYLGKNESAKQKIEEKGGKFFGINLNFEKNKLFNRIKFFKEVKKLLNNNHYDIVHINSVSLLGLSLGALISKKEKVKNVIVHSHNDGKMSLKYRIVKVISDIFLKKYADYYFACSENAAKWKFPKSIINEKKYLIIKNGINTEKFKFDENVRNSYRKQLGIENNLVIGHVGRFEQQKNHDFLINIFKKIYINNHSAILLLIGEGNLKEQIKEKVEKLGIEKNVKFLGVRADVNKLLSAMDGFLFPSIYEGLGIAVIEAEASGLPVICSDRLPKEVEITDHIYKLNLNSSIDLWAQTSLEEIEKNKIQDRKKYYKIVEEQGFEIKKVAKKLGAFYRSLK